MPRRKLPSCKLSKDHPISEQIFYFLRQIIVENFLVPTDKISENEIAEHFDVSRMPVRAAINELINCGLVEVFPQKGSFVTKISAKNLKDICFMRCAIECQALRESLNLNDKDFNKIINKLERIMQKQRNLTDSMKELLDTGIISKTLAADTIASLSPQEQEELISSLDTTKRITQKEMQKYIDEIHSLKANPPKPVDYDSTKRQLEDYKKDYSNLHSQFEDKVKEVQDLRKQMENIKRDDPSEQYVKKFQNSVLTFCAKVSTFIEQVGGYVWLTDQINEIPELEREGYIKAVHTIKSWADTMEYNINNKIKEIN